MDNLKGFKVVKNEEAEKFDFIVHTLKHEFFFFFFLKQYIYL